MFFRLWHSKYLSVGCFKQPNVELHWARFCLNHATFPRLITLAFLCFIRNMVRQTVLLIKAFCNGKSSKRFRFHSSSVRSPCRLFCLWLSPEILYSWKIISKFSSSYTHLAINPLGPTYNLLLMLRVEFFNYLQIHSKSLRGRTNIGSNTIQTL